MALKWLLLLAISMVIYPYASSSPITKGITRSNCRWECVGFGTFVNCRIDEVAGGLCGSGSLLPDCTSLCRGVNDYQAIQCCSAITTIDAFGDAAAVDRDEIGQ